MNIRFLERIRLAKTYVVQKSGKRRERDREIEREKKKRERERE